MVVLEEWFPFSVSKVNPIDYLRPLSACLLMSQKLDDIWASSDEDDIAYDRDIARREWEKLNTNHGNVGIYWLDRSCYSIETYCEQ